MYPQDDKFGFLPLKEQPQYRVKGLALYNFRSNFLDLENDVILVFCENAWEDSRSIEMMMSECFIVFCLVFRGGYCFILFPILKLYIDV